MGRSFGRMDPKEMRSQLSAVYGQEKASAGLLFGFDLVDWSFFAVGFAIGFAQPVLHYFGVL